MKTVIPILSVYFLFTGCVSYQMVAVNSGQVSRNEKQAFVVENDTIRLQYSFAGQDGPINLEIRNKLGKPLLIDWKRSALIVNDKAVSLKPSSVPVTGSISATSYQWTKNISSTYGGLSGQVGIPSDAEFIPPQSYISKTPMGLSNEYFINVPDSAFKREKLFLVDGNYAMVRTARFTEETSPFRFKSYLTLITGDSTNAPITYEHSFYVQELVRTGQHPSLFSFIGADTGNWYYTKKNTGFGNAATGFAVIGTVALISGTSAYLAEKNDQ